MEIIYKKPNKLPIIMNIENTVDEIVRLVDGWYSFIHVLPDVVCIYNGKGNFNDPAPNIWTQSKPILEPNVWVRGKLICGPMFFAGARTTKDGVDFCSIPGDALTPLFASLSYWGLR